MTSDDDNETRKRAVFTTVAVLLFIAFASWLIGACGHDETRQVGSFQESAPGLEAKIGIYFLNKVYGDRIEVPPQVYVGSIEEVTRVCPVPEELKAEGYVQTGSCSINNTILIAEEADYCQSYLHELAHIWEWLSHIPFDYTHQGKLKDWYGKQIFKLCEALGD